RNRVGQLAAQVDSALAILERGRYAQVAEPARAAWDSLKLAVAEEQRLLDLGQVAEADSFRIRVVGPALAQMDLSLTPIASALNTQGIQQVQAAQAIAESAATSTLLALAIALGAALLLGGWLTRSMLVPLQR